MSRFLDRNRKHAGYSVVYARQCKGSQARSALTLTLNDPDPRARVYTGAGAMGRFDLASSRADLKRREALEDLSVKASLACLAK